MGGKKGGRDTEGLRRLREKKGITQAALAGALGVKPQAVGKWERGDGYPRATLLPKLAEVLGCEIGELYAGEADAGGTEGGVKAWKN